MKYYKLPLFSQYTDSWVTPSCFIPHFLGKRSSNAFFYLQRKGSLDVKLVTSLNTRILILPIIQASVFSFFSVNAHLLIFKLGYDYHYLKVFKNSRKCPYHTSRNSDSVGLGDTGFGMFLKLPVTLKCRQS